MATGDNIRRYRKAKGLTQAQLADAVGLTEGAIRHYESGIRAVKPELLEEIAKALEVSVGALKDYGVETSRDLMALLLQLEEGYGLVPSEDGIVFRQVDLSRRRHFFLSHSVTIPEPPPYLP